MDLFTDGTKWLSEQLDAAGAVRSFTLQDKLDNPSIAIEIVATPGRSEWDEPDPDGVIVRTESRDWLVDVEQLCDGPESVRPLRGWYLRDSLDGDLYRVFSPGDAPWRYCGTSKTRIRIHTQNMDTNQ